jgi:hypothetical protein
VESARGTVLHCSRFGAVVRLDDGRIGSLALPDESVLAAIRRACGGGRRPQFDFEVSVADRGRLRLELADRAVVPPAARASVTSAATSLERKIIDYLRQTAEWDPRASEAVRSDEPPRADRLLPFEYRARRQYRESPQRPRRPKHR